MIIFFQNKPKNITEKTDTDLHFYKSLISGLTENSWILVSDLNSRTISVLSVFTLSIIVLLILCV